MAQATLKQQRLEARVTPAQKRLFERAAELQGTTVTAFVVLSAQLAATKAINESRVSQLSSGASDAFAKAVLNPPDPNATARAAARRYRETMGR